MDSPIASELPFELITAADPATHAPGSKKGLLTQREPPPFLTSHKFSALHYKPTDELLLAINMALHTASPLLLTGEPGTGKTQAADFVGAYFGIQVYKFLVKSTSTAQDLMYEFDAVGYLHWAQADKSEPVPPASRPLENATVESASDNSAETPTIRQRFLQKRALWQAYEDKEDAVVLIDEIDKAPRDFPNDLLHELDQHSFPHPFDNKKWVKPKSGRPPIVIITSNEERRLPDAFLRRCIFHRIELTEELLEAAVESLAGGLDGASFPHLDAATRQTARRRFWELRQVQGLEKRPSTAELLTWLSILSARRESDETLTNCRLRDLPAIGALVKDAEDLKRLP